jgi:hypothetical protein
LPLWLPSLRADLQSAQLDIARIHAAITDTDDPLAAFQPPEGGVVTRPNR